MLKKKVMIYLTYQAMLVGEVIGQLELVEGDNLLHPLLPGGGTVRVDVHPLGHLGVRLPGYNPPAVVELVAEVVRGHNVQKEDVLGLGVEARQSELHLREHLPEKRITYIFSI